jgi:hypothetical protein
VLAYLAFHWIERMREINAQYEGDLIKKAT